MRGARPGRRSARPQSSHQASGGVADEVDEGADLGPRGSQLLQLLERFSQPQLRAVQDAVRLAYAADLLLVEPAPLEPFRIHAMRLRWIACGHDVWRHVARDDGAATQECVRAKPRELMYGREATENDPVTYFHVAGQRGAVGEHGAIPDTAVMRNVGIGHEQVVVADARHALAVGRTPIDGAALAEGIAVADLEARRFPLVLQVLRRIPDGGELVDAIIGA